MKIVDGDGDLQLHLKFHAFQKNGAENFQVVQRFAGWPFGIMGVEFEVRGGEPVPFAVHAQKRR
jgi:hypothetical protein